MLLSMWRILCCEEFSYTVGAATMENSMEVPQKTKNGTIAWSNNSTPGYYIWKKQKTKPLIQKDTCTLMFRAAAAASKSLQLCPTLCGPIDGSPPGKNTGVGCCFLLQCMKVKSESEAAQSCPTLSNPMDCSLPGSSVHGFSSSITQIP